MVSDFRHTGPVYGIFFNFFLATRTIPHKAGLALFFFNCAHNNSCYGFKIVMSATFACDYGFC